MNEVQLRPVDPDSADRGGGVSVFIHGYRSLTSDRQVEAAKQRIRASGAPGRRFLLDWSAGRWRDSAAVSATFAGLRAAHRASRLRHIVSPWMLLVDAGVVSLAEVAQFKWMERRADRVGRELPALLAAEFDEPVNLIGHSLGARVVHRLLAEGDLSNLRINDCVLLGGAADLEARDWRDCLRRIDGRLYNAYSPRDRILQITPDLRRRVGGRPMRQVIVEGERKVVNHRCDGVGHFDYWTRLDDLLPRVWRDKRTAAVLQ